ncbi:chemotaxis protein CheW [Legionella sp. D16C41]|uniref:chemotaxis protein CheW n=1 Tax=Legionella sp. D16C41 TaxID=3402688 RepID=UPI003AF8724C
MNNDQLNSPDAKAILARRKAVVAEEKLDYISQKNNFILVFKVDELQKYALSYTQIEYVIPYQQTTAVPGADPIFSGVIYYNNEVWPVISCHRLFKMQDQETVSFFILCRKDMQRLALSVNKIVGQLSLKENEELFPLVNEKVNKNSYVQGIYQIDIALIDLDAIFNILTPKLL